jgi:hypothetical protein
MIQFGPKKPLANSRNTLDFWIIIFWNWPISVDNIVSRGDNSEQQQFGPTSVNGKNPWPLPKNKLAFQECR